ncbi:MAG: ATP-binding cassette domain-containing protein [Bacteroidota bacterium]
MSITVTNLSKYFGDVRAVDGISFTIPSGQILGFLGPNGAGKTTTMRMITSYLLPTEGTVEIDGLDIRTHEIAVRKIVGYLPEQNPLYSDMNVLDYLEYSGSLQGIPKRDLAARVKDMVGVCGLSEVKHLDIGQLSKGYRQRVGLAQAMIHDPKVLILDEPTSGLDPNQIAEIRNLIKSLGKEKTLILSTHILPEVQATCDRVLIINRGKIVADGSPTELQGSFQGKDRLHVEVKSTDGVSLDDITQTLSKLPNIETVKPAPDRGQDLRVIVETNKGLDVREQVYRACVDKSWVLIELHRVQTSLEEVFHQLTTET